jgi:fucose permease
VCGVSAATGPHYRWVVLAVSVLVNITIQLQWIALSPVSATAAAFYGVSTTQIGYFSIVFMVVFIPLSIPAAWLVDRYGIRLAVGLGACAFAVGFLLTGAMPVGMQYASEIAAPTPEGASSGLFQLCGQASFVVVLFMDAARTGDGGFVVSFAVLGVLLAVIGAWMARQPEPSTDVAIPGDLD